MIGKVFKIKALPGQRFELQHGSCPSCKFFPREMYEACRDTPCGFSLSVREVGFDPNVKVPEARDL